MSEERIKERCKREDIALKIVKGFLEKDCYTDTELEYSLNTLLDLYNTEKEKNRQCKMRIKQLENEITARIEDVNKNFISKDKIINEIKKLEQMSLENDTFGKMRDYAILILKELLEE